jgi:nitrite reductase/ring-hydroxylating ferredoxin subunit
LQQAAAIVIGGIAALVPVTIGVLTLLDPLRRRSQAAGFVRVASLDAVAADGLPHRFAVLADRTDAWNGFVREPIGAVYLRRTSDQQVEAFNSICPHAGCFIDFDNPSDCYRCPCHNSTFHVDGTLIQPSPSPRGMDSLVVQLRGDAGQQDVWVQFQNFYTGIAAKVPKT